uniref:Taste receptor type 2 n=1 Tax=Ditylenchus dipsaci TaxID=166011 RepID=A0A915DSS6_9BILA
MGFSADLTGPLNIVIEGVFWSSMVSYVSLSLMKLYAIACPLMYWKKVTMSRVIVFIVFSWFGFVLFVIFRILLRAKCTEHTCLMLLHRIVGAVHLFCYLFTVICFLFTVSVLFAWHTQSSTNIAGKTQENIKHSFQIPMIKLSLNVATLTICHLPLAIIGVLLAFGSKHFWLEMFPCFVVSNLKFIRSLATFVQCVFMLRIVLDSLIGFATDKHIRKPLNESVSPTDNNELSGKSSMPARSTNRTL